MLQLGDEATLYSVVFVVLLLGTRSPMWTTVLTASLYLFMAIFRFPQVPTSRSQQVLHPAKGGSSRVSAVAHRGGGHDAPENTLAAIREVRALFSGCKVGKQWVQRAKTKTTFTNIVTAFSPLTWRGVQYATTSLL